MDDLTKRSIDEFLDAVAQRTPTPGGGSVAAAAGALACALARMVGAYSVGKNAEEGVRDRTEALVDRLRRADEILRGLVTQDAVAYAAMSAAERAARENATVKPAYQDAVLAAAAVPMETAAAASQALAVMDALKDVANRHLLSDLGVAAVLAEAAARAAWYMVTVNLPEVADAATRTKLREGIDKTLQHCHSSAGSIEGFVRCVYHDAK
jgi:formiminotetrahydrofolate cyclodeaminase